MLNTTDVRAKINFISSAFNKAVTDMGIPHIRTIPGQMISSYMPTHSDAMIHAVEHDLAIEVTDLHVTQEELVDSFKYKLRAMLNPRDNVPQVIACRRIHTYAMHNAPGISIHIPVSFYDKVDFYELENGEKLYVTALLEAENHATSHGFGFQQAFAALLEGKRICRRRWKEISYILFVPGSPKLTVDGGRPLARAGVPIGTEFQYAPHIDAFIEYPGELPYFMPWQPSQLDLMAEDWYVLE